jgi:hypothetical protein
MPVHPFHLPISATTFRDFANFAKALAKLNRFRSYRPVTAKPQFNAEI